MGTRHGYKGELGALRDRLGIIVKANGWVCKNGHLNGEFGKWFKTNSHLPVSEIEALFLRSRFAKQKPEGELKILQKEGGIKIDIFR